MLHRMRKSNHISCKVTNEMGRGSIEVGHANNADAVSAASSRLGARLSDPILLLLSPLPAASVDNESEIENQEGMPLQWRLDLGNGRGMANPRVFWRVLAGVRVGVQVCLPLQTPPYAKGSQGYSL
jgi:hypothetical protein